MHFLRYCVSTCDGWLLKTSWNMWKFPFSPIFNTRINIQSLFFHQRERACNRSVCLFVSSQASTVLRFHFQILCDGRRSRSQQLWKSVETFDFPQRPLGWLSIWSSLLGSQVKADLEKNKTWSNILYEKTQRRHNRLVASCGNTNIKVLMQPLAFGVRCELWMLSCNSSFTSIQVKSADSDEMTLKAYLTLWESISFKIKKKT